MFKRKIYNEMLVWKRISKGKTALFIEGARRIGKSTVALEFAKNEYDDYLVVDFAKASPKVRRAAASLSITTGGSAARRTWVWSVRCLPTT